jgi:hypothetical protein
MVALEPKGPLLLYVTATAQVVSMVLVIGQPVPEQHQVPNGAPADSSRSQDLEPVGEPGDKEVAGS